MPAMVRQKALAIAIGVALELTACGGAATTPSLPASQAAAASAPAPASTASAKPAVSASAAAKTSAGASSAAPQPVASGTIKGAYGVLSVASTPMWAALDEGLYKKEGLNVELSSLESAALVQAVVSGSIQVATGSTVNAINAIASGADLRPVAAVVQTSSLVIVSKPEIGSLADLKGQTIAVTQPLSSSDFITRLVLKKNGLEYNKDVKVLTAGTTTAQVASFQAGQVQAITGPLDVVTGLPANSYKMLLNIPDQHLPFSEQSLMVSGAFGRANPQAVASFIKAFWEGSQLVLKDYDVFARVAQKHLQGVSEAQLKTGHNNYQNVWSDPANPRVTPASVQTILDLLAESNPKVAGLKYEDVIDNSYIQRLKAQGAFANGGCQGC